MTIYVLPYVNVVGGHSVLDNFCLGEELGEPALGLQYVYWTLSFLTNLVLLP